MERVMQASSRLVALSAYFMEQVDMRTMLHTHDSWATVQTNYQSHDINYIYCQKAINCINALAAGCHYCCTVCWSPIPISPCLSCLHSSLLSLPAPTN